MPAGRLKLRAEDQSWRVFFQCGRQPAQFKLWGESGSSLGGLAGGIRSLVTTKVVASLRRAEKLQR